jgi:FkbM family methyltransferase
MLRLEVGLVIDVGANVGQYAMDLRQSGYTGEIISFEPLSQAFAQLSRNAEHDESWTVHNVALGSVVGVAEINVASNLASSSLLGMLDAHRQLAPQVTVVGVETAEIRALDSYSLGQSHSHVLLKLDVQGFEGDVLRGAAETLSSVVAVECELSVHKLYESQETFLEMLNLLDALGYDLEVLEPGLRSPSDGEVVQFDGLFVHRE